MVVAITSNLVDHRLPSMSQVEGCHRMVVHHWVGKSRHRLRLVLSALCLGRRGSNMWFRVLVGRTGICRRGRYVVIHISGIWGDPRHSGRIAGTNPVLLLVLEVLWGSCLVSRPLKLAIVIWLLPRLSDVPAQCCHFLPHLFESFGNGSFYMLLAVSQGGDLQFMLLEFGVDC